MARGFIKAALAGAGEQIVTAATQRFGVQPFVSGQAEYRSPAQAFVQAKRFQQLNQAAEPDATAARHHRIAK